MRRAEYGDLHAVGFNVSDGDACFSTNPVLGALDQPPNVGLVPVNRQRRQGGGDDDQVQSFPTAQAANGKAKAAEMEASET